MSSILKVDTIQDQQGNLIISKDSGGGGFEGDYFSSSSPKVFTVTVAAKTAASPYHNVGSSNGYFINGIQTPIIELKGNDTGKPYYYKFDQSDASNSGHPLRFYNNVSKTTQYTSGVTTSGTPGSSGAYTQIEVDFSTTGPLHYQCSSHAHMGHVISMPHTNRNKLTFTTDKTNTGNGSTTGFTVLAGTTVDNILVFVNGICLVPTDDYTISVTTLTFATAPANTAEIVFRYLGY